MGFIKSNAVPTRITSWNILSAQNSTKSRVMKTVIFEYIYYKKVSTDESCTKDYWFDLNSVSRNCYFGQT